MKVSAACLAGLVVVLLSSVAAAEAPPRNLDELRARVARVLLREHVPGAGIALVDGPRILWAGGVGVADRASGRQVTGDTLFRVGSITKSFVALALVRLAEQGRVDLHARVGDLAPELAIGNRWDAEQPIAVAHLLAALVQLALARGRTGGAALISPAGMARIERSETARLDAGDARYGLGNYGDVSERLPIRGHDGGTDGFAAAVGELNLYTLGIFVGTLAFAAGSDRQRGAGAALAASAGLDPGQAPPARVRGRRLLRDRVPRGLRDHRRAAVELLISWRARTRSPGPPPSPPA